MMESQRRDPHKMSKKMARVVDEGNEKSGRMAAAAKGGKGGERRWQRKNSANRDGIEVGEGVMLTAALLERCGRGDV